MGDFHHGLLTLTEGHWRYAWSVNELTVYAAD